MSRIPTAISRPRNFKEVRPRLRNSWTSRGLKRFAKRLRTRAAPQTPNRTFSFTTKRTRRNAWGTQRRFPGSLNSMVGVGWTAAAYALQKFYRGMELPVFIDAFSDQLRRRLRILPDKTGPIILLRSFGTIPFWREAEPFPLAHPWLIYSELMNSSDPRAHEAAEELKREYLS